MSSLSQNKDTYPFILAIVPKAQTELTYEFLWQNGTIGFETISEDIHLEILKIYFDSKEDLATTKKNIEILMQEIIVIHSGNVDYSDWLPQLHGGFQSVTFGNLVIVPAEDSPEIPEDKKPVYIVPGRGFGTGSHPTTATCLQLMQDYYKPDCTLLDVGTGSGILSIAAAVSGAKHCVGIDIDEDAIENARENARLNNVEEKIEFLVGSIESVEARKFDIVCANIISKILKLLFEQGMANNVSKDGMLYVSGILDTEVEEMSKHITDLGFIELARKSQSEWYALAFSRK